MSIQASKPNNRVFLLLGIVLAALAFGGVLFALRQGSGNTVSVVVAKSSIPAGTTISTDQVATVSIPSAAAPSDAYTVTSAVTGKTTTVAVGANDPLVPSVFAAQPLGGQAASTTSANGASAPVSLETSITKGFVAMAIPAGGELPPGFTQLQQNNVSADLTSAGFYIQAGDHIDILVLNTQGQLSTRFSFQDIPVLRVGTSGSNGNSPTVYIVEVARGQAELLTGLITGQGHETVLKYVLRPESEWGKVTPGNAGYTPNYEASTGAAIPATPDTPVEASTLDSVFGH